MRSESVFCIHHDGAPWPQMLRIHASTYPPARYYLCRECGAIREDPTRGDGTIAGETRWHELESADLPAAVVEQVRAILEQPRLDQLSFLPDEG